MGYADCRQHICTLLFRTSRPDVERLTWPRLLLLTDLPAAVRL